MKYRTELTTQFRAVLAETRLTGHDLQEVILDWMNNEDDTLWYFNERGELNNTPYSTNLTGYTTVELLTHCS